MQRSTRDARPCLHQAGSCASGRSGYLCRAQQRCVLLELLLCLAVVPYTASRSSHPVARLTSLEAQGLPCCKSYDPEAGRASRCKWMSGPSQGPSKCETASIRKLCPVACGTCAVCSRQILYASVNKNVTVLGLVDDVGGKLLSIHRCTTWDCTEAIRQCFRHPHCDTVEVSDTRAPNIRDSFSAVAAISLVIKPVAVLRSSWVSWGPRLRDAADGLDAAPHTAEEIPSMLRVAEAVKRCAALASTARSSLLGVDLPLADREQWRSAHCSEYCAPAGQEVPRLYADEPPTHSIPITSICPRLEQAPRVLLLSYATGPSPWLCNFLRTLDIHGMAVTVLGWEPDGVRRLRRAFYMADRIYAVLRFLKTCALPGMLRSPSLRSLSLLIVSH